MEKLSKRWMYYCGILAGTGMIVNTDDLKHIQDLIDAEEQGLLIKLPCKVGDTVWGIVEEWEEMYEPDSKYYVVEEDKFDLFMIDLFGKCVFLTKEAAEEKLKEMVVE